MDNTGTKSVGQLNILNRVLHLILLPESFDPANRVLWL
jgi:hypothetical protein